MTHLRTFVAELEQPDTDDTPRPGDRYRLRLEMHALDGSTVTAGTELDYVERIRRIDLGDRWHLLRTIDGRLLPLLVDPMVVDKLPAA